MISTVFDNEAVQILCTCKRYFALCRTYFCRYCYQVRCASCITHEVDCYYCPTCLETMASGEANSRKDKCSNCFDCPSCGNMLSLRASVMQVPKVDEAGVMKAELQKLYYMACSYCRWTTRESDIPDRKTSTNSWPEFINPNTKRIKSLVDSFNHFASKEKLDKERTKYVNRKNYFFLTNKGIEDDLGSGNRRRYSTQMRMNKRQSVDIKPIELPMAKAQEDIDDISETYFSIPFALEESTNITQRLRDPERQPSTVKQLIPIPKQILVKRSMRCRKCDHNLCKPEIASNSIKFKINLGSVYHIPEIKVKPLKPEEKFEFNKPQKMILTITNPAHRVTTVKVGPIAEFTDEISTARLDLPKCDLKIGAKNEIMGFDEIDQMTNEFEAEDDPKIIATRKQNKIEVFVTVTPMKSNGHVISCVQVTFDYKDATSFYTATSTEASNVNDVSFRMASYKLDFGSITNAESLMKE